MSGQSESDENIEIEHLFFNSGSINGDSSHAFTVGVQNFETAFFENVIHVFWLVAVFN